MHSTTHNTGVPCPEKQSTHAHPTTPHHPAHTPHTAFSALLPALQKAVAEEGYTVPTPIQEKSIPHLLEGKDLLGCAQTGTGKTAAFTLPLLHRLAQRRERPASMRPRMLVLAPTRELAAQVGDSVRTYGRHLHLSHTVIFGGVGQWPQVAALRNGVDILIATPGRLLDLMRQRCVRLDHVEAFVLDEADRMLDMGFINDVRAIIEALPQKRQSLFFSATLARPVIELAHTMVKNPVQVTITPEQPTVERIIQKVMFVNRENKALLLSALIKEKAMDKVLVFTKTKNRADKVTKHLLSAHIHSVAIHGNKTQAARMNALSNFRAGKVRALVATDIAARGLDVDGITHVINFDLPTESETYIHRVGRTARAGAEGDAISLCCSEERDILREIERLIRMEIPCDRHHPWHSETARNASGSAARPPPKTQHGHRPRGGVYGKRSHHGQTR
jgi:ATP-dependent RNA helicase RhlE